MGACIIYEYDVWYQILLQKVQSLDLLINWCWAWEKAEQMKSENTYEHNEMV